MESMKHWPVDELRQFVAELEMQLAKQKAAVKWTRADIAFVERRIAERENEDVDTCL